MNLDIHLDCCDAIVCTGYFEVHITEEIFKALNICQYKIIIIYIASYKTTGDTCNGFLNRNTGSHQRHGGCTDGSL